MLPEQEMVCGGRCGDVGLCVAELPYHAPQPLTAVSRQLRRLIVLPGVLVDE